ncbi:MFS transporter [Micromonospora sp. ALFpr18c]|uniref:MFS transporter n=1 Tax=Micromonospora sp. ALFpr18c TaxID=1458665 RepID=UPI001788ABF2|nr:MFS transporter [Micromonospora sp. ALFpr18c]
MTGLRASLPRGPGLPWFSAAGLINALGNGFYYPFMLLFFRDLLDVSLARIGVGLTVAALATLPLLPAVGRAADRFGPRPVLIAAAVLRGLAYLGYLTTRNFVVFMLLSALIALCNRAEQASVPVLATALAPEGERSRWLALSRVLFNAGFGAGALLAGLALTTLDGRYALLGLINAVSFLAAAACYLPLRAAKGEAAPATPVARTQPWRDRAFGSVVAAGAVLWVLALGVEVALPVVLIEDLALPSWTVSVLFTVNTALLTLLQLPVAHRVENRPPRVVAAIGALLHGGLMIALLSAGALSTSAVVAALIAGMVVYTIGEMLSSQAVMVLLTALAPEGERGSYLAFNQIFIGAAGALAPAGAAILLDTDPALLWWLLLVFGAVAAVLIVTTRRTGAAHRREATVPTP